VRGGGRSEATGDAVAKAGETPILTPRKSLAVLERVSVVINGMHRTEEGEE